MDWKKTLQQLEKSQDWDLAIKFMEHIIHENPTDMDAYLSMNYLLMNLLVEEDHNEKNHAFYEKLTKKYFDESYKKFSHNPEYLYYTGITAHMSEWYFGITTEKAQEMLHTANKLDPQNLIYQWDSIYKLDPKKSDDKKKLLSYALSVLDPEGYITKTLQSKGSLGEYILEMMTHRAHEIIEDKNPFS